MPEEIDDQPDEVSPAGNDPGQAQSLLRELDRQMINPDPVREGRYKGPKDTPYSQPQNARAKRIVTISPRANPSTGRSDPERHPQPYDPFSPDSIADVAQQIRGAAVQTETPSQELRIAQLERLVEELKKEHDTIYPPRAPSGLSDSEIGLTLEFVSCTADGGDNGDENFPPTWTYEVINSDGDVIATNLSPANPRQIGMTIVPAGPWVGLAEDRGGGDVTLFLVEQMDAGACPDGTDVVVGF